MRSQKVVVLRGNSLMAQGLEALLRSSRSIDVVGIDLGDPDAWERLRLSEPAAVLVEPADLVEGKWSTLWRLLEECANLSIILVHPTEDTVSIYSKHLVPINDSEDLVTAIVGASPLPRARRLQAGSQTRRRPRTHV